MEDKIGCRKWHYLWPVLSLMAVAMVICCISFSAKASSGYPYLIKVNRKMSTATVYKKDSDGNYTKPVKAMLCSPGYDTPLGTYKTKAKYRWKLLMGDVWGQYSTRIVNGVLFHSVWYYKQDASTLSNKQFNNLGTICSHGCVRLSTADAKWIYDNCSVGTTVVIYDSNDPGPLGKPEGIKVSATTLMGYDPTDIWSSGNPYNKLKPSISGVKSRAYKYGAKVGSLLSGVKALSSTGTDITDSLTVEIQYNGKKVTSISSKKAGIYKILYQVTDALGKEATKTTTVTVKQSTAKPVLKGVVKNSIVAKNTKVTRTYVLKKITATWNGTKLSKSNIQTKITKSSNVYTVKYTVKAPNNKTCTATAKITVDNQAPVFKGIADHEIAWDDEVTKDVVMQGVTVSDNYTKMKQSDITVTITKTSDAEYTVTYKASDGYGNTASKKAVYKIIDFLRFEIPDNLQIKSDVTMDTSYIRTSGIKAYDGDTDITKNMGVAYELNSDGNYDVILTITDAAGHIETAEVTFIVYDNDEVIE